MAYVRSRRGRRRRQSFWAAVWRGAGYSVGFRLGTWIWRGLVLLALAAVLALAAGIWTVAAAVPADARTPATVATIGAAVALVILARWMTSQSWGRSVLLMAGGLAALGGTLLAARGMG